MPAEGLAFGDRWVTQGIYRRLGQRRERHSQDTKPGGARTCFLVRQLQLILQMMSGRNRRHIKHGTFEPTYVAVPFLYIMFANVLCKKNNFWLAEARVLSPRIVSEPRDMFLSLSTAKQAETRIQKTAVMFHLYKSGHDEASHKTRNSNTHTWRFESSVTRPKLDRNSQWSTGLVLISGREGLLFGWLWVFSFVILFVCFVCLFIWFPGENLLAEV